jgi:dipeptidase
MACDSVLALGDSTLDRNALFGQNNASLSLQFQSLRLTTPHSYSTGEKVGTQFVDLPQVRNTLAVLGSQPSGRWGYDCGVNSCRLAVGCTPIPSALTCLGPALQGTDLVRLLLERSHSARQAVDLLAHLIERHGQGAFPGCPCSAEADYAFLIADPFEAYAVETAGPHWVCQEVREIRVAGAARIIRQDWDAISRGFAALAIDRNWWPEDGSKLDFAAAMGERLQNQSAWRRWGRATLRLQEQFGSVDLGFLRRLLADHGEDPALPADYSASLAHRESFCRHSMVTHGGITSSSFVVSLAKDELSPVMAWCAFGPPCLTVYFPIFLDGELPEALTGGDLRDASGFWGGITQLMQEWQVDPQYLIPAQTSFARLQARFDQDTEEFALDARRLHSRGWKNDLNRQATAFMQHAYERFEEALAEALSARQFPVMAT